MVPRRFVICTGSKLCIYLLHPVLHRKHICKCSHCLIYHTPLLRILHYLREISDSKILRFENFAGCWGLHPHYQLQNGRFTCAILPHKGNMLPVADMKINTIKKGKTAERDGQIVD